MSKLITASLVGAVDWLQKCPPSWRTKALDDLTNQLARRSFDVPPPSMQRGMDFEAAVYSRAGLVNNKGSEHFMWFVEQCRGGIFQKKTKRYVEIDGVEYCLYGRIDVWFHDVIKDIKTTGRYRGKEKYLDSFQHKLYCFTERIPKFKYLVAEFQGDADHFIVARHEIEYVVEDWARLRKEVLEKVRSVITFLKHDEELFELYNTTFSRY